VSAVLRAQRVATIRKLQEFTRLKAKADEADDQAWLLVLDLMIFRAESEVRWLDHSEARLSRTSPRGNRAPAKADRPKAARR
jgi:virulence activator alpha